MEVFISTRIAWYLRFISQRVFLKAPYLIFFTLFLNFLLFFDSSCLLRVVEVCLLSINLSRRIYCWSQTFVFGMGSWNLSTPSCLSYLSSGGPLMINWKCSIPVTIPRAPVVVDLPALVIVLGVLSLKPFGRFSVVSRVVPSHQTDAAYTSLRFRAESFCPQPFLVAKDRPWVVRCLIQMFLQR